MSLWLVDPIKFSAVGRSTPTVFSSRQPGVGVAGFTSGISSIASAGAWSRGGAPKGNRNALKHGGRSAETLALKREIQALARMARETIAAIE